MSMTIIYADELLVLNALLDYILLLSAARLRGAELRRGRFFLAALLGGVYALLAVLPGLRFLSLWPCALALSGLMALIAYGEERAFFRAWAGFLALSAAFAGAVYALSLLRGGAALPFFAGTSLRALLLSFGLCYAAVRVLFRRFFQKCERRIGRAELTLLSRSVSFSFLADSGNELFDPVSALPVMTADVSALLPLFPPECAPLLLEKKGAELVEALAVYPELAGRLRLVPYRAVGVPSGMLAVFRPDRALLDGRECRLLVAVSPTELGDLEYAAIF